MQHSAKKAAETVVLVIDEEGIDSLISELLKGISDNQVSFFRNSFMYCILLSLGKRIISSITILLTGFDEKRLCLPDRVLFQKQQTLFGR